MVLLRTFALMLVALVAAVELRDPLAVTISRMKRHNVYAAAAAKPQELQGEHWIFTST